MWIFYSYSDLGQANFKNTKFIPLFKLNYMKISIFAMNLVSLLSAGVYKFLSKFKLLAGNETSRLGFSIILIIPEIKKYLYFDIRFF